MIVEEIFVNIVDYSKTEFIDNGIEFNPLLKEDPEIPTSIDEANIGGPGIFLTKEMADELYHNFKNDENHLKIIKKVQA